MQPQDGRAYKEFKITTYRVPSSHEKIIVTLDEGYQFGARYVIFYCVKTATGIVFGLPGAVLAFAFC
jgi:hypothetical protein